MMQLRTFWIMAAVLMMVLIQVADFAPVAENNELTVEQHWVDLGASLQVPPADESTAHQLEARGGKKKKSYHKKKSSSKKKTQSKKKSQHKKKKSPKKKGSSGGGGTFKGDGTYYNAGMGSCGIVNTDHDMIAALNAPQMGPAPNPNKNKNCGKYAKVTGPKGTVRVKIVDTCPPCLKGSLDLSPAAFAKIADLAAGRVPISWSWD